MMVRQIAVTNWRYGTGRCESYASRRGWTMALQVREVNSWAAWREAREKVLEAARRREIDLVPVWRLVVGAGQ
jgi:hypothetical protein